MTSDRVPYSFRQDGNVPGFGHTGPLCVMDAQCALCAGGARWIARNDHRHEFRIVPLQSVLGQALMRHYGMDPGDPTSWLFLSQGRAFGGLDALVMVGMQLGGVWQGLRLLRLIPRGPRDWMYRAVAKNRYRWFGKADLCQMPDPAVQERLLR
jgi:predicted DCC family thiol-disulfide oxidoreductase YuxK